MIIDIPYIVKCIPFCNKLKSLMTTTTYTMPTHSVSLLSPQCTNQLSETDLSGQYSPDEDRTWTTFYTTSSEQVLAYSFRDLTQLHLLYKLKLD